MEVKKTRHLSTYEFLQTLQVEYVVAELRRKIYIKKKDKVYYKKVLEGKQKKINDICLRNSLPSIFDNESIKTDCYKQVYPSYGYPNFHHKNDAQIEEFEAKDFYYYYYKGSDFRVNDDNDPKVGEIMSVDQENSVAYIKLKGEENVRPFILEVVSRII